MTGNFLPGTAAEVLADIGPIMDEVVGRLGSNGAGENPASDKGEQIEPGEELLASLTHRLFIPDQGAGNLHADYGIAQRAHV